MIRSINMHLLWIAMAFSGISDAADRVVKTLTCTGDDTPLDGNLNQVKLSLNAEGLYDVTHKGSSLSFVTPEQLLSFPDRNVATSLFCVFGSQDQRVSYCVDLDPPSSDERSSFEVTKTLRMALGPWEQEIFAITVRSPLLNSPIDYTFMVGYLSTLSECAVELQ